jgi:hypothetical protein
VLKFLTWLHNTNICRALHAFYITINLSPMEWGLHAKRTTFCDTIHIGPIRLTFDPNWGTYVWHKDDIHGWCMSAKPKEDWYTDTAPEQPHSAEFLTGCLLGGGTFRVYDEYNKEIFTDYVIHHPDMAVCVHDEDAYVYENPDGSKYIDVSKRTLGIK